MGKKKEKPIDLKNLEPEEKLKYEVDKVMEQGWRSLTSKETGRIGGLVTKKRRSEKAKTQTSRSIGPVEEQNSIP